MEQKSAFESFELEVNNEIKDFLKETSSWSYFMSIIGFIGIGLMVIFSFFAGTILQNLPNAQPIPMDMGLTLTITYLVIAVLYFFPVYYLFQFSNKMKTALLTKNDDTLSDAFEVLKSHYKFMGVFTIIILSLYALIAIFGVIGALAM